MTRLYQFLILIGLFFTALVADSQVLLECQLSCWTLSLLYVLAADGEGVVEKPVHTESKEDVVPCGADREVQTVQVGACQ